MGLLKPIHAQTSVAVREEVAGKLRLASRDDDATRARLAREHLEKLGAAKTRLLLATDNLQRHLVAPAASGWPNWMRLSVRATRPSRFRKCELL